MPVQRFKNQNKARRREPAGLSTLQNSVLSSAPAGNKCLWKGVLLLIHNPQLRLLEGFGEARSVFSAETSLHTDQCHAAPCSRARRGAAALQSHQARRCRGAELLGQQRRGRGKLSIQPLCLWVLHVVSERKKELFSFYPVCKVTLNY